MNTLPFPLSNWTELDPTAPPRGRGQDLTTAVATTLVVALACCLGSQAAGLPNAGGFTSFWPAAGLALVAVLWRGPWALPGVLLGRLLFDALPTAVAGPQALGAGQASLVMAGLSTLQAALGAWALHRGGRSALSLTEPGPILRLLALAGASSLLCGSYTLAVRYAPAMGSNLFWLWLTAVAGDLLGVLLLTPVLLLSLQGRGQHQRRQLGLWLIVLAGYLSSWAASAWVLALERQQIRGQWDALQTRLQHDLQTGLRRHELMLESLATSLGRTPQIDRRNFAQSAQPLLGLADGPYALSWNPVVSQEQRAAFEAAQSRQHLRRWQITERSGSGSGSGLVPAAHRALHVPVQAIEPALPHQEALGFDVYADALRRAAIDTSLKTSAMAATQRIHLVQETQLSYGVLAFMPLAQAGPGAPAGAGGGANLLGRTRGFAVAVLPLEQMITRLTMAQHAGAPRERTRVDLDSPPTVASHTVAYRLRDMDAPAPEQTLWAHNTTAGSLAGAGIDTDRLNALLGQASLPPPQRHELVFAGRHYCLESWPLPGFWAANTTLWPYMVFTAGLWMTVAGSVIVLLFTGYRQSLAHEVEERTVDLLQIQYSLTETMHFAQAKSDQLGFLLQHTPVGFLGFDEAGRYLLGNQALVHMLGLNSLEELPNINVFISVLVQRLPGIGLHRLLALGQSRPGQGAPELQLNRVRLLTPQGQTRHVTLQAMKYPLGPVRHLFTLVDLSSDVALESSKSEFISLVAHEIRTPLTGVQGYAELLLARPGLELAQRQELASAISVQARQIQLLLTKMLNLSELEVGGVDALRPRVQNTRLWLAQMLKTFRTPAGRQPPDLRLADDELHARIDPRKLERGVTELLDNAYSFSGPDAPVQVQLQRARGADGRPELVIAVIDQGVGMDDAQRARACDKFYRVDKSGEKPGCGLGLPLVKLIAELHQGRLELRARADGPGLVAAISLPLTGPA